MCNKYGNCSLFRLKNADFCDENVLMGWGFMETQVECPRTFCLQNYMIVLEEEVLPTADFLQFMAQCLDIIVKDTSLIGASAWNDNGQCCIVFITAVPLILCVVQLLSCQLLCHVMLALRVIFCISVMVSGYVGPSSNLSIAYRVETFPGFGFLLRKAFYKEFIANKLPQCCNVR